MGPDSILEDCWGDVLAASGNDDLLLPSGDGQEPLLIQFTDISSVEPSFGVNSLGGGRSVVPVPLEHLRSLDQDLAIVSDVDSGAWDGAANGADLLVTWLVEVGDG